MELKMDGYVMGRYRVRSLMRKLGLKAKTPGRYKATADSSHKHPVAPNRLDRQFDVAAPTGCGPRIFRMYGLLKAGCTWPSLWIFFPAGLSVGRWTTA